MATAKIVPTAKLRPGKCAISGETTGPFLDTGTSVPRYGRIYLSPRWLKEHLTTLGYLDQEDAKELEDLVDKTLERNAELEEVAADYQTLIDVVSEYLPTPEPEVREVPVIEYRKPSDEEIADWIEREGGNHPAVRRARPADPGSTEEWQRLYGTTGPQKVTSVINPETDGNEVGETEVETDDGPAKVALVHGQEVDLDKVLDQNVADVISFTEGKGEEFEAALIRREHWRAEKNETSPRKGVLQPLGYWDEEDDEPLYPADDEEEETLNLTEPEEEDNASEDETEEEETE